MDPNSPAALLEALRDSGLYSSSQLTAYPEIAAQAKGDPITLADTLLARKLLTPYQSRKVRVNRIFELIVGQYLILDKVGEGGMGKVYKAVQLRMGRQVALKIVRGHLMSNKVVMRRYKREAAAAAAMNHPNIVALLDADEAAGRYYLAMEFVDGSDMARLVKEFGPLPYPEAAEYMRQAALGLQHAHDHGLIHRDIKPSNLLVTGDRALPGTGGQAVVKILDMGLVRSLTEDEDASKTELTRDGTVVGTPDYMSPEQAKNSSTVDGRSDLYSLGCTLHMLLSGKPPFPDGTPIDKLLRHQLDPPPDIRKKRPDVPRELAAVLEKMLAKKKEDRYQRADELAADLSAFTPDADPNAQLPKLSVEVRAASHKSRKPIPEGSTAVTTGGPKRRVSARSDESPVAIPRPQGDHSSDTMPASQRTTPQASDTPTSRGLRNRRAKARARRRKSWLAAAAVAAGVIAVGALAAWAILGGKPSTTAKGPPTTTKGTDSTNGKDGTPITLPPPSINLPDAAINLPDGAVAVIVLHPQPYLANPNHGIQPDSRLAKAMNHLSPVYKFDPRQFDRLTVGFTTKPGVCVAVGEGLFANADWARSLEGLPGVRPTGESGPNLLLFPEVGGEPVIGGYLPGRGYALGYGRPAVGSVVRQAGTRRPPAGLTPGLREALPDPTDPTRPIAMFAADGQWAMPGGIGKLADFGVQLAVVRVRLAENVFDVDITLRGPDKKQLQDFVSLTVPRLYAEDKFPDAKPFVIPLIQPDSHEFETQGNQVVMRMAGRWGYLDFHDWLERLLTSQWSRFTSPG